MSQNTELMTALEALEREKGVSKAEILSLIEGAMASALRKHLGKDSNIVSNIDPMTGSIEAWQIWTVRAKVEDPNLEMPLGKAKQYNRDVEDGDEIKIKLPTREYERIAAQTAKQVLIQKMREVERETLYTDYKPREGEVITGSVHRFMDHNIIVDLGKAEAIIPVREQIRRERYRPGDRIKGVIVKVDKAQRGPQILISRAAPVFLQRVMETEIPEVAEKVVEVVKIVRDPGFRAKVLVRSNNPKVDPIGACVGIRGSRIRSIMNELSGERIDLINHNEDSEQLILNALSPAKATRVRVLSREERKAEVIVPNDQLSIAIGREGQNIRLACQLTGWSLDVKSEDQKSEEKEAESAQQQGALAALEGVGPKLAEMFAKSRISVDRLATASVDELTAFQGVGEDTATKIIEAAKKHFTDQGLPVPTREEIKAKAAAEAAAEKPSKPKPAPAPAKTEPAKDKPKVVLPSDEEIEAVGGVHEDDVDFESAMKDEDEKAKAERKAAAEKAAAEKAAADAAVKAAADAETEQDGEGDAETQEG